MTDRHTIEVVGTAVGAFAGLEEPFGRAMAAVGGRAALCIVRGGRVVVDLRAGGYPSDGLQLVFSVSKAMTAIAVAMLEADGIYDPDEPLAEHWSEFARPSVRTITPRMVLAHRSGIAAVDVPLTMDDLLAGRDADVVARQEPYWEPGTAHGYHAATFGTLVRESVRRSTGLDVADVVRSRIAEPLGLDLWLRSPASIDPRIVPVVRQQPRPTAARRAWTASSLIPPGTTAQLAADSDVYNSADLRRLGLPSTSGVAGAEDLARMMAATIGPVGGTRILDSGTRERMTATRSDGPDHVLGITTAFGSGVQRPFPVFPMTGPAAFGHEAAGGSAAFADPDTDIAVGFVTDLFPPDGGASRALLAVLPTIRHCLDQENRR